MKKITLFANFLCGCLLTFGLLSCSDDNSLSADYEAPKLLPDNIKQGTPLGDARLALYNDYGIIVYTDPSNPRFTSDLVSEGFTRLDNPMPADTEAALLYIKMIRNYADKFLDEKPKLVPRNYYFLKNKLKVGNFYAKYYWYAYLWYNSKSDITVGRLNNADLDTTFLKASFYYGLSSILRSYPRNSGFMVDFKTAKESGGFYWQINSQEEAYKNGYLSANQSKIIADALDFDLFAAWAATAEPAVRDSLLNKYSLLKEKYLIVTSMFRQEGLKLEEINADWQASPLNPDNS